MAWTALKGSPRISSHPRPLSWIVATVGALAVFLIYASWVLVSSPIGATVQGYFYSVGSSEKLDLHVSNEASIDDGHLNKSLDLFDNKPPSEDLQSSTTSTGVPSDDKIEHTNTTSNSQVDSSESSSVNLPTTKEVNNNTEVFNSGEPVTSFGQSLDVANSSLPTQENSEINLDWKTTAPLVGINSSNETGNIGIEEPTSGSLINQSSAVSTASNETSISSDDSTSPADPSKPNNTTYTVCDLYHGNWIHDPSGPLYTNNSCPVLTQMQNCQGNGRPDKDYENWRWKPFQCDLPRFDPKKFLELMRGKTLAFIGDSVARNQMESMLCILWQVETPKNRGNRNMQRYYFRSTSFMIVRIWSSWLVKLTSEPFAYAPAGVDKLHLDFPDEKLMEHIPKFDVVVLSSGHWFAKQSVYILNNEIVGGQLWWPDKFRQMKVDSVKAYGISVETILTAIATIPNYKGLTIVRSYSPDHYEGGAWNTGGSCTGKIKPLEPDQVVENVHTNIMHGQQVTGFNRAVERATNGSKLRLMDITEAFQYRHDGHPGPYRSPDPNKITKRGPDGRPPPQDCLHWCMPGPVDTWNELVFEVIRREYEVESSNSIFHENSLSLFSKQRRRRTPTVTRSDSQIPSVVEIPSGLKMSKPQNDPLLQSETTCGTLLYELQIIWDEVGESESDRDRMLFELEQECLEVYRRKVDQANRSRAQLRQAIADCEAELAAICSSMGERPVHIRQTDQNAGSLREEHARILPQLEEMQKRKSERRNEFIEVQEQIQSISLEIYGTREHIPAVVDETDLSLRKLEELHRQLHALQIEKSSRLKQVQEHLYMLNSLCLVLGLDFKQTINGIHPSLVDSEGSKSVSNDTIQKLAVAIQGLREVKLQRMQKLQDLATTMLELWNLMDTPIEEQQMFQNVTCNIAASEHEVTEPNTLSVEFINLVETEVGRLEELKSSKMKELVLKKRTELEDICRKTHLIPEIDNAVENAVDAIESGSVDPACVLEQIELQISQVKEEAFSRKEILEKVEKWLAACDEESWLEEYNRDDNRYNAGRGAHLTLKRAEKARTLVNKIPAMVDALTSKTIAWEKEKGTEFTYDGIRLLSMLEEYTILRQEKEQERRRQRDLKKLQGQMIAEQEALYGSKPSPSKPQSVKKGPRMSTGGAVSRRVSLGGAMLQTPKPDSKATQSRAMRKTDKAHPIEHLNYLDDGISGLSAARRGLDIAGVPVKKHSFGGAGTQIIESPLIRQPFSPISSNSVSSKANVTNATDELNMNKQSEKLQKTLSFNNVPFTTPSKTGTVIDEENRTPKTMPIPVPATPSTVSVPMNMAMTPLPSSILKNINLNSTPTSVPYGNDMVQEIEYSFEEKRLSYMLA
ncbi:hypothetical protein VNO78_20206 [Psophocarpus tetragonolobus]|uniref:Uncharacterized protein n=1 Tax=Psophocarpus tetragonolobus TaxID=3891 RepID=A0AAN9S9W7_PSOTE